MCVVGYVAFFGTLFGRVPLRGRLLASGDALIESVPACLARNPLWSDGILLGYPLAADPNQLHWYPMNLVCSFGLFDLLSGLPFLIAALGMTGFVLRLTRSWNGAIVAGLAYALSGFLIAHAGHLMISHTAAWAPWVLWAFEELRTAGQRRGFTVIAAAVAIALCTLGGQPQVPVFVLTLAFAYACASARSAPVGAALYLRRCLLASLCGLGLAAPLLVPAFELFAASTRRTLEYALFTADALPLTALPIRLAYPYFLGGSAAPWYPLSIGTLGSFTEQTNSCGPLILLLAAIGVRCSGAPRALFWGAVALLGWVLSTGPALGSTLVTYRLPVFSLFHEPGRHAFESNLAVAVLAGYAVAALGRGDIPVRRALAGILLVGVLCVLAWCAAAFGLGSALAALAESDDTKQAILLSPLRNPALGIPLAFTLAGSVVLLLARSSGGVGAVARFALVALVATSGAGFALGGYWNWAAEPRAVLRPPPLATRLAAELRTSGQRALWLPGTADNTGIAPNLSLLWNVPETGGYTPLVLDGVGRLLDLKPGAPFAVGPLAAGGLDIAATRFLVLRPADVAVGRPSATPFLEVEQPSFLGGRGPDPLSEARYGNDEPIHANRLSLISALGFSAEIPQGTKVGEVTVTDARGRSRAFPLRAGIETAESAAGRPDVAAHLRHRLPPIYASDGQYNTYRIELPLSPDVPVASVVVRRTYSDPQNGALSIHALSLVDDRNRTAIALGPFSRFAGDPAHWRRRDDGGFAIFEDLQAVPRAWIPHEVRYASDPMALEAIQRFGRDGVVARDLAFVSDPAAALGGATGSVRIVNLADGAMDLRVDCARRCFVLTSDAWYPGWEARIDGAPVALVRADVALRGVLVAAGRHSVHLRYKPATLVLGFVLFALACGRLLILPLRVKRRRSISQNIKHL